MALVLACDLGGSGLRAGLVDRDGRIVFGVTVAATGDGPPGLAQADPQGWWRDLVSAADALAAAAGAAFDTVAAVAVTGFTRSQVFLGAGGAVLRPALLWADPRAAGAADRLAGLLPAGHPETAAINAFHPLARLAWLAAAEPAQLAALAAMVEPKDYLNARLTGVVCSDRVSAARLLAAGLPAGGSLFEAAGLPRAVLPALRRPGEVVGAVLPGLPGALGRLAGRAVLAMGHDTWAAALGLGALRPGLAYNLSGTTEVLGVLTDRQATAEGLLSVDWGGGLTQLGGPSQAGGDTLAWLLGVLGVPGPLGAALEALLAAPRDPQPVLFLPYLQGERTPYWDPALRGAWLGLHRRHTATDLAYAVLEGIACLNRIVLERAEAATGAKVAEVRFGGGGAANAPWCQVKADIMGREVVVAEAAEPGLIGAAIVGFAGLGVVPDLAAGQDRLVRVRTRFTPRADRADFHGALYAAFREAEAAVGGVSKRLAGLGGPPPGGP